MEVISPGLSVELSVKCQGPKWSEVDGELFHRTTVPILPDEEFHGWMMMMMMYISKLHGTDKNWLRWLCIFYSHFKIYVFPLVCPNFYQEKFLKDPRI